MSSNFSDPAYYYNGTWDPADSTNSPPKYHYMQSLVYNPDTPMRSPQPISPLYCYFDGDRYLQE
ncbi:hypothetical protein PCASD_12035, partial [Puccinia coronata f. sp. avenae]